MACESSKLLNIHIAMTLGSFHKLSEIYRLRGAENFKLKQRMRLPQRLLNQSLRGDSNGGWGNIFVWVASVNLLRGRNEIDCGLMRFESFTFNESLQLVVIRFCFNRIDLLHIKWQNLYCNRILARILKSKFESQPEYISESCIEANLIVEHSNQQNLSL